MKKTIAFLLLLCMSLCSCGQEEGIESRIELLYADSIDMPDAHNKPYYQEWEYYPDMFGEYYIDETASDQKTVEILGKSYDLTYINTRKGIYAAERYYDYNGKNINEPIDYRKVVEIDPITGKVLDYVIQYEVNATTEQEYLDFIQNIIFPDYDLSQYDYRCVTNFNLQTEQEYYETGFFEVSAEDEKWAYQFEFVKTINGYDAMDQLFVSVNSIGELSVSAFRGRGFTEEDFKDLLNDMDEIEAYICNQYLQTDITEGCKILRIGTPYNHLLYYCEGIPCVRVSVSVDFEKNNQTYSYPARILVKYTG